MYSLGLADAVANRDCPVRTDILDWASLMVRSEGTPAERMLTLMDCPRTLIEAGLECDWEVYLP